MASSAAFTTALLPKYRAMVEEWEAKQSSATSFVSPLLTGIESGSGTNDQNVAGATDAFGRGGKDVLVAFRTRPPLDGEAQSKFGEEAKHKFGQEMAQNALSSAAQSQSTADDSTSDAAKQLEGLSVEEKREAEMEKALEDLQVEFCPGLSVRSAEPGVVVAHVPGTKWSGPTLQQKTFTSDLAFGPHVGNDEVYARTVLASDLLNLVVGGGVGCVLAYGQTGAGKTYTMESLEHRIARDIFPAAKLATARFLSAKRSAVEEGEAPPDNIFEFTATFLEILGKHAFDLLEGDGDVVTAEGTEAVKSAKRQEVKIQENKVGEVRPRLIETVVSSAQELEDVISRALSHRRTSATHRNAVSSRSHAVLTLRIKNKLLPFADEGVLLLVDLAGSERHDDRKAHNKERMEEARENNKTLMNLKDCVRAKAKTAVLEEGFVHVPFRATKLTLALKPIFDIESRQLSKTIVIAHASPHLQDTAHTVSTLSYASPFKTTPPKPSGPAPYDATDPRTWDHTQTIEWLTKVFTAKAKKTQAAQRIVRDKAAKLHGKSLAGEVDEGTVPIMVDLTKLCPEPMTAKNIGRLYASEWIERCLQARTEYAEELIKKKRGDEVERTAAEVYGAFNYLLLTARVKTRNDVMKSRKKLAEDAIYGDSPWIHRSSDDPGKKVDSYSEVEMMVLQVLHGDELRAATNNAQEQAKVGTELFRYLYNAAIVSIMEKYRDEVLREIETTNSEEGSSRLAGKGAPGLL